jgi:hypothetical protein
MGSTLLTIMSLRKGKMAAQQHKRREQIRGSARTLKGWALAADDSEGRE